jgi:hypothetical protein
MSGRGLLGLVAGLPGIALLSVIAGCASANARTAAVVVPQPGAPALAQPAEPNQSERDSHRKNFVVPAVEIVAMDALVNLGGRQLADPAAYQVTLSSIRKNLRGPWVVDDDPFQINQFLHPYQGAMYHDIARSMGLNYWQSLGYTLAGSAMWEIAGEKTAPSVNDQIASGIAGTFLGEPLFRAARLWLDQANGRPGFWRVLTTAVISPPVGVNHMLFGDRYDPVRSDVLAASDVRLQLGVAAPLSGDAESWRTLEMGGVAGFSVDHGFPGKSGYAHARPFDYFNIEATASSEALESLATRGLIAGTDYGIGHAARGVWGLYGSYDYFAPDVFRLSSTALSIGSTAQWWLSDTLTLQSTALAGAGYTATQEVLVSDDRDSHYGLAPQVLIAARLISGRRASVDFTAREYYVSDVAGFGTRRHDVIFRGDAALALRLYRQHAIAIKYVLSRRDATQPDLPRLTQSRSTIGVFYTFLGSGGFGAVR